MSARTSLPESAAGKWQETRTVGKPRRVANGSPTWSMAACGKKVATA
jgi:hypothetical protein